MAPYSRKFEVYHCFFVIINFVTLKSNRYFVIDDDNEMIRMQI